jgi:hypothetical protein
VQGCFEGMLERGPELGWQRGHSLTVDGWLNVVICN